MRVEEPILSIVALCRRASSRSGANVRKACHRPFASSSWAMRCSISGVINGAGVIQYPIFIQFGNSKGGHPDVEGF